MVRGAGEVGKVRGGRGFTYRWQVFAVLHPSAPAATSICFSGWGGVEEEGV